MGIQYAGEYNLEVCELITSGGVYIDLKHTIIQLDLFEEIFKTGITGSITVADTNGIVQEGQVIGQDYLRIKISTPSLDSDDPNSTIDYTDNPFIVHKINSRFDVSKNGEVFQLNFMSPEVLQNYRIRLSRSFTETNSKIFEQIMRSPTIIDSRKRLHIENTNGVKKYVAPNVAPFDFIGTMIDDSVSKTEGNPHFLFFENTKGYHFRSLQSLYNEPISAEFNDGDVGLLQNEGSTKVRDIEQEFRRALYYETSVQNDMLANITGGLLGSTYIQYNMFHKKYSLTTQGYFDNFKDYQRINGKDKKLDNPIYTENSIDEYGNSVGDFKNARVFLGSTNVVDSNNGNASFYNNNTSSYSFSPNTKSKTVLQNMAKMFELNSTISATLQVNGHTNLAAGQCINMSRPSGGDDVDEEFSGKFLITKLRHVFSEPTRKHEVMMSISKDSSVGVENKSYRQPKGKRQPITYIENY